MAKDHSKGSSFIIEIDTKSGFCFGVSRAVKLAEEELKAGKELYCLGDIVHNEGEIERLNSLGMQTIMHRDERNLDKKTVLFRAHGEPPQTYKKMKESGASIVDATCPVVLKLQSRIKKTFIKLQKEGGQLVIYGKKGHAEVIGLVGQTDGKAYVVESPEDIYKLDRNKKTVLFCQTTMSHSGLLKIEKKLKNYLSDPENLIVYRTICAQVGNRVPHLQKFVEGFELILFVGGLKSSNGKYLFESCREVNPNSYYVSQLNDIKDNWFVPAPSRIGICGATSTPQWLMEKVADAVRNKLENQADK